MMVHLGLGLGAGLVSALLFATAGTGAVPAVLLMYLAPLPIMIVALGWHHLLGLLALSSGALVVTALLRPVAGTAFALGPALCAWLLAYAALLRRPGARDGRGGSEDWLPLGAVLMLAGILAAGVAVSALVAATDGDYNLYRDTLRRAITALATRGPRGGGGRPDPAGSPEGPASDFATLVVTVAPALLGSMLTLILVVNLWAAGRVVALSGRLPRPWPDVSGTRMPLAALAALVGGALVAQLPGFAGVAGTALLGGLGMAFALQGLTVLHAASRGRPGRGMLLSLAYVLVIILGYVFLPAFALLGMADTAFPLRRALGGGRPPAPPFT